MRKGKRDTDIGKVCDYCGKHRDEVRFFIGYAPINEIEWVMWEGTGKCSCENRDCWSKANAESCAVIKGLVRQ